MRTECIFEALPWRARSRRIQNLPAIGSFKNLSLLLLETRVNRALPCVALANRPGEPPAHGPDARESRDDPRAQRLEGCMGLIEPRMNAKEREWSERIEPESRKAGREMQRHGYTVGSFKNLSLL